MSKLLGTVNILGTEYEIFNQPISENPKMNESLGISELWAKAIIIDTEYKDDDNAFDNVQALHHKVLRHEAFHCIFHEAGLRDYCDDERLVDALALLYPKIHDIMDILDSIDLRGE